MIIALTHLTENLNEVLYKGCQECFKYIPFA